MAPDTPTLPDSPPVGVYEAGQVIGGKYVLERLLGQGGMGSVWSARNLGLDSLVAIKFVGGLLDRDGLKQRLIQEARAAARLRNPAIIRIFDVGQTEQGEPFIVMELLEGYDLGQWIRQYERLDPRETVQLLLPIADALVTAHLAGVVHRDVKPDNVFVALQGKHPQPKLVDFGTVKLDGDSQLRLTQTGVYVGTPAYMSPEQARGRQDVDYQTDIWSFCVVLYEAASGRMPFDGPNYNALLNAIVEETPPTLAELGVSDSELSRIVERGMKKQRLERWASMGQLGTALASWLVIQGVHEDATGASLAAKWLGGSGARPARTRLLASLPPGALEPRTSPSGVVVVAKKRDKRVLFALLAGALLLGTLVVLARSGRDDAPAPLEHEASVAPSEPATDSPTVVPVIAPEPAAVPEPAPRAAPKPGLAVSASPPKTTESRRAASGSTARSAAPPSTPSPAAPKDRPTDLMNPY